MSRGAQAVLRRTKPDLAWLLLGLAACVLIFVFLHLSSEVMEGDTQTFDVKILHALRKAHDPSKPIGPEWVAFAVDDLTSLGSPFVLGLMVVAVTGFLLLQTHYRMALVVLLTSSSGALVGNAMKALFVRPRPTVVPHLREVVSSSFPSGHAMDSAVIYLTLAAMLMRISSSRLTKAYLLTVALGLTFIVGMTRLFLGVHYPSDVLGGWMFGFVWASVCWLVARHFEPHPTPARKHHKP
jgi:undecaprenyl-diphosphatase